MTLVSAGLGTAAIEQWFSNIFSPLKSYPEVQYMREKSRAGLNENELRPQSSVDLASSPLLHVCLCLPGASTSRGTQFESHCLGPDYPTLRYYLYRILYVFCCCCSIAKSTLDCTCQAPLSFTVSWSLLKFMSIESVTLSNQLILCCPLLQPSILPRIRVFSNGLALHIKWPVYLCVCVCVCIHIA